MSITIGLRTGKGFEDVGEVVFWVLGVRVYGLGFKGLGIKIDKAFPHTPLRTRTTLIAYGICRTMLASTCGGLSAIREISDFFFFVVCGFRPSGLGIAVSCTV